MNWYKKSSKDIEQEITSKDTSINIVPSVFKKMKFNPGTTNADIGGGKFDSATNYMKDMGVNNVVYDPYNREAHYNTKSLKSIDNGKSDTSTCANVLNVISNKPHRDEVIQRVYNCIKNDGTAYFQIYEGDKSGIGKKTTKGWQNNQRTIFYIKEIKKYFKYVSIKGNIIIARGKK